MIMEFKGLNRQRGMAGAIETGVATFAIFMFFERGERTRIMGGYI
jgi:hypothetical protein